jgi:hypothetical protein
VASVRGRRLIVTEGVLSSACRKVKAALPLAHSERLRYPAERSTMDSLSFVGFIPRLKPRAFALLSFDILPAVGEDSFVGQHAVRGSPKAP